MKQLKASNIAVPLATHTVSRLMNEAGFRYAAYKKMYYVDRHEAPDVVASRKIYVEKNFHNELRERTWTHMTMYDFNKVIESKGDDDEIREFIRSKVHIYPDKTTGTLMVEVNINDLKCQTSYVP